MWSVKVWILMTGEQLASFFDCLNRLWGPHTIDRFASHKNTHLARFNSRYFVPGTEAVDAFTTTWAAENNWLVPPISCCFSGDFVCPSQQGPRESGCALLAVQSVLAAPVCQCPRLPTVCH